MTKSYSPTDHIEKVLNEFADLMESEAAAGRVGEQVVDKFNHLVNTWNKASKSLNRHRSDYRQAPAPSIQVEEKLIEVAAPPVNVTMPDTVVGVERPQVNFVRLSVGFINLNEVAFLDVKAKQVYFSGIVKSLDREDVVKLIHWMKAYKAH